MIIPHFSITGLDVPFFVDTLLIFSSLRNLTQCAAPQSCVFQPACFNQILANWGIILIKSHEITIVFLQIPWASHETTFFVSSVQLIDDVPWFSHWNANFPSDFPRPSAAPPPLSTAEAGPDPWAKRRLTSSWYSCGRFLMWPAPLAARGYHMKNDAEPLMFSKWKLLFNMFEACYAEGER